MRRGPIYAMQGVKWVDAHPHIPVPLELMEDFMNCQYINWRDDKQGCFTLIIVKLLTEACEAGHKDRLKVDDV